MKSSRIRYPIAAWLWLMVGVAAAADRGQYARDVRPILQNYCFDCHYDGDDAEGGVNLERFESEEQVLSDRGIWKYVFDKVESRQMPPPKESALPTDAERRRILDWIAGIAAAPDPALGAIDPGKPILRRLTRLEYNNTVRDLLALDIDLFMFPERLPLANKNYFQPETGKLESPLTVRVREYGGKYPVLLPASGLPGDNRAEHGYRNRGDAMNVSPLLLEKYVALASEIVHHPDLPRHSAVFAWLLGIDAEPAQAAPAVGPRERLVVFLRHAFRRPLTDDEIVPYVELFESARQSGRSEADAIRVAVQAVLSSPSFLFLAESANPSGTELPLPAASHSPTVRPLTDHELANRLSYFLWSSMPDEELMKLADSGELSDEATLTAQTLRMLRDPKSRELSESFAVQWLRLDQLYTSQPDRRLFKQYYSGPQGKNTLHASQLVEALLLFETVQVENRSILDLIAADYTWVNPRLARLYEFDLDQQLDPPEAGGAVGNREQPPSDRSSNNLWWRLPLADSSRGGYLTMSAPLTVTSLPFRTSPVKRGAWMLETIFNRPPTEPKVAFAFDDDTQESAAAESIRARFEAHRSQAACYSCHIRIDPPGFALEHFDAIGAWREFDGGQAVDARGEWNGRVFDGPAEFKSLLRHDPHEFTRGFIEHLLSYALGRKLELADLPIVEQIQQKAQDSDYRLQQIVCEVVASYPFRHLRSDIGRPD